jgi:hypothetical protein
MRTTNGTTTAKTESVLAQPALKPNGTGAAAAKKSSIFDDMEAVRAANLAAFGGEQEETATAIKAGRPSKSVYFRCPLDPGLYLPTQVWQSDEDSSKSYFVAAHLWHLEDLQGGLRSVLLCPWMGADGSLGLWPVPASGENEWSTSALSAIAAAKTQYVRVQSDRKLGRYRIFYPRQALPEKLFPPALSLADFCSAVFGSEGVVDTEDHQLIRHLRGLDTE